MDQPGTSGWNKPHLATASNRYRSLRTQNGEAICGSPYSVPIVPGGVGIRSSQARVQSQYEYVTVRGDCTILELK